MRAFVAVTDLDWLDYLRHQVDLDEANFWQPNPVSVSAERGAPWLFKARAPFNAIVGGGFFAHYSQMPVEIAWEAFGAKNGVATLEDLRARLRRYQNPENRVRDVIGCVVLSAPFFLEREAWIPTPESFQRNTQKGKYYDLASGEGAALWDAIVRRLPATVTTRVAASALISTAKGSPILIEPRLGQGGFRLEVLDAYDRRCAVTGERTLPALEAAHIKPFSEVLVHEIRNGIALRSDLHRLFDRGYVTIGEDYRFRVSRRIRDEYENGRDYYALHERSIRLPESERAHPDRELLDWHQSIVYKGD